MSLVTGLLNKTCTIKRPTWGNNGGNITLQTLTPVRTGELVLIDRRSEQQIAAMGGRENVGTHVGYFEFLGLEVIRPGDILTDLVPLGGGAVETDVIAGLGPTRTVIREWLVKDVWDPNNDRDHLEVGLESVRGKTQPE